MDDYQKFYDKALRFLSFRPRSEKEVKDNLVKKKAPQEIINQIISKLKEQKFVNDEEFTEWWIEQRSTFKPRSARLVRFELLRKGISKELIDSVSEDSEVKTTSDLEQAKQLVAKKIPKLEKFSKEEQYQKLLRHLSSRGFDYSTSKEAIDDIIKIGV